MQRVRLEAGGSVGDAIVVVAHAAGAERVVACSEAARRCGVSVGMRAPDAQSLAGPGRLRLVPHTPGADRRALGSLAIEAERFSPTVGLEDSPMPEALVIGLDGLWPLWGGDEATGEAQLIDAVRRWLAGKRVAARLAVGPTPALATAVARFASGEAAQAGAIVLRGVDDPRVDRLPTAALRLEPETTATLGALGIEIVGDLRALPRASLPARFGPLLLERLDQLLGDVPQPIETVSCEPPLSAAWPFETAVGNAEALAAVVRRLLDRLCEGMRKRRCGALRVLVTYLPESDRHESQRIALRLFRPTASPQELHELAELHSEGLRFTCRVREVRVLVGATAPMTPRQRTLFDDNARDSPHELALLVNRLAGRVGFDRVSRAEKRRSVEPSRSFQLVPAVDNAAKRFGLSPAEAGRRRRLPLRMAADGGPSVRVVLDAAGEPIVLFDRGERGDRGERRVVRVWGPERIETGWWRGRGVRRDAWWVELEDGARLWLCHDLRSGRWRLVGEFA